MTSGRSKKSPVAPYLPFAQFYEALDDLSEGPLPSKIDASVFRPYSGTFTEQLIRAFKFFDLIDDDGHPKPALHDLVDPNQRKAKLGDLVLLRYAPYLPDDLSRMAPSHLDEALEEFGVTGSTRQKATTFFVRLAEAAGIAIPKKMIEATRSKRRKPRTTLVQRPDLTGAPGRERKQNLISTGRINLKSGGTVTLAVEVHLFQWSVEDQHFVSKLIHCFNSYLSAKQKVGETGSLPFELAATGREDSDAGGTGGSD